ncbi:hypothetical protein NOF04DRAFT_1316671 [Fusarium oxysporum II5]|nr:hypothetical protein NOF04DRAFT_1337284 [Fusarium oxysporum II5]KAK2122170.1 hypothetical protein NOF04DRAFT_1337524 [Fusarium oxysporum II5]KAK2134116.1 hypothetical protein NOF04DRAFT_1316671 [Fusarium oxysporum II5]TVY74401.1 hypothetical protein Focb16_v005516 [Fusarium oxysporum f. sp. cubense]TXB97417.1 hypothetical protein FocTR4_00011957 [Fusarium oxysporum f. sp. cubense]
MDLVIYYNDSIDSDNLAAASALFNATYQRSNTRVLWILEPRQVRFGLSMAKADMDRCKDLISQYFPSQKDLSKCLLNGSLKKEDIDVIPDLTLGDREILEKAVKAKYGPVEDAVLHARLSALDLASCLAEWSNNGQNEVLVDYESLSDVENPVNLHMHHHEELPSRSAQEVRAYNSILGEVGDSDSRAVKMRGWYDMCIRRLENNTCTSNTTVEPLVLGNLVSQIQNAKSVRFFGGSSLRILRQFLDRGVGNRVRCHLQVGTCDISANRFSDQFNIALNQQAAKIVLSRHAEFAEFTVVPSHTVQSIEYSALGLKHAGGQCMEKRILGFNCHQEPVKIVTNQVSIEGQYSDKFFSMPDLTSILCALVPGNMGAKQGHIKIDEQESGTLLFVPSHEGIPMFDLDGVRQLDMSHVKDIFHSLTKGEVLL